MNRLAPLPSMDSTLLDRSSRELEAAPTDAMSPSERKEFAAKFEGLLVHELIKTMRSTVHSEEDGFGVDMSMSMMDEALSDSVAGHLGVGEALMRQMDGNRGSQNKDAAAIPSLSEDLRRYHGPSKSSPYTSTGHLPTGEQRSGITHVASTLVGRWPVQGIVSSEFGRRIHPISGESKFHAGIDIAADTGSEIRAVQDGTVVQAGKRGGYGLTVEIEHADGTRTLYAHASRIHVRRGDRVEAGEAVADVGSTGHSTGPHLHFEVTRGDHAVDPRKYLEQLRGQREYGQLAGTIPEYKAHHFTPADSAKTVSEDVS